MAPGNRKTPQKAASSDSQYTLLQFTRDFPDDETCLRWLWNTRYNLGDDEAHCERCGEIRTFRRYAAKQQRQDWTCTACGLHVHPTAGTIFHKSSTSLHLWFYAMYLMTSTRCGISAKQLERELGVTYKTAWRMFTLIRNELMNQDDTALGGEVEADETYVGGKRKGQFGRPRAGDKVKTPVFGMVERGGQVVALTVPNAAELTLLPHMRKRIQQDSKVFTDEWAAYKQVGLAGYTHRTIRHSDGVYVSGDIHTNTIEGFWSLVKRGISGTHHAVSRKWLQGYLNEYAWRYNHRDVRGEGQSMFGLLLVRSAFPVK